MTVAEPKALGAAQHKLQAFGPFIVVITLIATLWTLVLWVSHNQQLRLTQHTEQQLRLVNNSVVQQTRGLLQGIENDLRIVDHWIQSHPQTDPHLDRALSELIARLEKAAAVW